MPKKMKPKEVGKSYLVPQTFTYSRCTPEKDGWVDPSKYLPFPYDLVNTRIEINGKIISKIYNRWWTGEYWDGRGTKLGEKIILWKKNKQIEDEY